GGGAVVNHDHVHRRSQRLHLAQEPLACLVPVLQHGHDGRDPGQLVEKRGPDGGEGRVRTGLEAGQHVEDVVQVGQAAAGADLVDLGAGGQDVHHEVAAAVMVGDGGEDGD